MHVRHQASQCTANNVGRKIKPVRINRVFATVISVKHQCCYHCPHRLPREKLDLFLWGQAHILIRPRRADPRNTQCYRMIKTYAFLELSKIEYFETGSLLYILNSNNKCNG